MIEITVKVTGAEELQQRFEAAGPAIVQRVRQTVQRLGIELQGKVKAEKLSGQVLKVRTGRLRRSINEETLATDAGAESTVGTPVAYARAWELGFNGVEHVKAHTRDVFGVEQQVRAHSRTVHMVARPFLQTALAEMKDRIIEQLGNTAKGVV